MPTFPYMWDEIKQAGSDTSFPAVQSWFVDSHFFLFFSVRKLYCYYMTVKYVSFLVSGVSGKLVKSFSLLPWLILLRTCFDMKSVEPGFFTLESGGNTAD